MIFEVCSRKGVGSIDMWISVALVVLPLLLLLIPDVNFVDRIEGK